MFIFPQGSTSVTVYLWIKDTTTGAGKTGLLYNSAGLVASYIRPRTGRTAITLATQSVTGSWSSGGFVEVDATNMPGLYRFDMPDAALAAGENYAIVQLNKSDAIADPLLVLLDALPDIITGSVVADGSNSATTFKTDLASTSNDFYKDSYLLFRTGALAGQQRKILGYNGSSKFVTVPTFTGTPNSNDLFTIINR